MKTKVIVSVIFQFCTILILSAQVSEKWVSRYNGPGNDEDLAISIAVDNSGNVYVTGLSWSNLERDFATIKYDSSGVQKWIQRYDGPGNGQDESYSIAVDGSGNVYVTGRSRSGSTAQTEDYATIKYNSEGVQQWVQRYNGPANDTDWPISLAVDGSGNVYVTGWSMGSAMNFDFATVKYNSAGVQQWVQRYDGTGSSDDQAVSLSLDNSGNVYVTGISAGNGTGNDYVTIKYNTAGVQQWVQRYNGPGNSDDVAYSIAVDGTGNVYVTGGSIGNGTSYDYATIKYNSNGDQQWVQRYDGQLDSSDIASSVKLDGSGNVYVTGVSVASDTIDNDYTTIKYNSNGDQQWVSKYAGPKDFGDWGWVPSLVIDGTGNAYLAAYSISNNGTNNDYAIVKYNSNGDQQWVQTYNGTGNGNDGIRSIALDGPGNIYVTGTSYGSGSNYDFTTIKYSQAPSGIALPTANKPIFNLTPNPAVDFVLFQNNNIHNEDFEINIYDITGILVRSEILKQNQQQIYIGDLNSGIYIVEIKSDNLAEKQKIIVQR